MERKSFLDQEPPPGYIAGIGRGATGFTTQADLGSSRRLPAGSFAPEDDNNEVDEERFLDADNDDTGRFGSVGDDDDDADRIYDEIEAKLQRKKARPRKRALKDALEDENKVHVQEISIGQSIRTIGEEFKEYKEKLSEVSAEDWLNLPDSGDFTKRNKRARKEMQERQRFYRNSDLVTSGLRDAGSTGDKALLDEKDVDLTGLSLAKEKVLAGQLTSLQDDKAVSVDAETYLSQLQEVSGEISTEIGDYHKTRTLFAKMRETNPYKPDAWIASARLEYEAKKYKRARELIQQGCEKCPRSEEAWLVNIEMNKQDVSVCKVIIAEAVRYNAKSVRLWLCAASLEADSVSKKRILRKALEFLPRSSELWLEVVKYEDDETMALRMLQKATELVPGNVPLWLEYAKRGNTKQVLEQALEKVDSVDAHTVWIEMAKDEEQRTGNEVKIGRIVESCFEHTSLDRETWLDIASQCEKDGFLLVARAIVFNSMNLGVSDDDKLDIWKADALERSPEISRSIYMFITANCPDDIESWMNFIKMEKSLRQHDQLYVVYEMARRANPKYELFYLMYAKDRWKEDGDVEKAKEIIAEGLEMNPESEDLWFAALKLRSGEEARQLFVKCREQLGKKTARVWYKNVTFERQDENRAEAKKLAEQGIQHHPKEFKLYLQWGQILEEENELAAAAEIYHKGTLMCPNSPLLWVHLVRAYEKLGNLIKARSILDQAVISNPFSDRIQLERVLLEERAHNRSQAERILATALKKLPNSALLWRQNILYAKQSHRKNLYTTALNSTNDHPMIILTIAKDMWLSGKVSRAKQFFDACYDKDAGYGDYYIQYYAFLMKHGTKGEIQELEARFKENDPHSGEEWCALIKDVHRKDTDLELLRKAAEKAAGKQ
ncbi:hypothetical protein KL939_001229 [Ogataea angusta]|nr:hypothetical protein KL939_001229 [Ogataea angusta]